MARRPHWPASAAYTQAILADGYEARESQMETPGLSLSRRLESRSCCGGARNPKGRQGRFSKGAISSDSILPRQERLRRGAWQRVVAVTAPKRKWSARTFHSQGDFVLALRETLGLKRCEGFFQGVGNQGSRRASVPRNAAGEK